MTSPPAPVVDPYTIPVVLRASGCKDCEACLKDVECHNQEAVARHKGHGCDVEVKGCPTCDHCWRHHKSYQERLENMREKLQGETYGRAMLSTTESPRWQRTTRGRHGCRAH